MITRKWIPLSVTAVISAAALAQYAIDWQSIDAGGGGSSGGGFTVVGTIGQADAGGSMVGGNYALTGGFWSMVSPVGPSLEIAQNSDGTLSLLWPSHLRDHTLHQSPDLEPQNWTSSTFPVSDNGVTRSVTFTPPAGRLFFRLAK